MYNKNSLNFICLLLAILVIIGHTFPLVLGESNILESISGYAVNMFFCISGFLIFSSAQKTRPIGYLWRRVLRIFPGYWVSLLFVIFIASPFAFLLDHANGQWNTKIALTYFVHNFDLIKMQWNVGYSPIGIPYEKVWNGSLWTLHFEFLAYLLLIPLAFIPVINRYPKIIISTAFAISLLMAPTLYFTDAQTNYYWNLSRLMPMFLAGSCLYVWGGEK